MAGSAWPGAGGGGPLLILLERSAGGWAHTGQPPVELPVGANHSRGGTADLLMKWAGSAKVTMDTLFFVLVHEGIPPGILPAPAVASAAARRRPPRCAVSSGESPLN